MYGKKLHIIIAILICMLISIAAAEEVKQVKSIKVKKNSVTVTYNETCNPEITIAPEDATNPKLDWASTDESVCIVKDGMLYATGAGSCEVTFTTADGSNKSVKVKVFVPMLDKMTKEIEATSQDELIIPYDMHGKSISDIDVKIGGDKVFLAYAGDDGIHVFPKAKGKDKITLTNKSNKNDKATITIAVPETAIDASMPRAVVVLSYGTVKPGDKIEANYFVSGIEKPYTMTEIWWYSDHNGTGTGSIKKDSGKIKYTVPKDGEKEVYAEIRFADANGNAFVSKSNRIKVDHIELLPTIEFVAIQKNVPITQKFTVDGGSGKFNAECIFQIMTKDSVSPAQISSEKLKVEHEGEASYTYTANGKAFIDVTVKDAKNNKMKANYRSQADGIVITDDWYLYIEGTIGTAKVGEPYRLYLVTNDYDRLKECDFSWSIHIGNGEYINENAKLKQDSEGYYIEYTPNEDGIGISLLFNSQAMDFFTIICNSNIAK